VTTRCPRCERGNGDGRRYCGGCGASLELACGGCAFVNAADERFCGGCGDAIGDHAPRAAPAAPAGVPMIAADELRDLLADLAPRPAAPAVPPNASCTQDDLDRLFGGSP
jgi:Double zinc ribbon